MAIHAIATAPTDARTERYRAAERALWDHYGIAPTERFVELSSPRARLRIVEVGSGRPILFLPGTPGTGPYWGALVRELPGFRCLMVDRPGWGLSEPIGWGKAGYGALVGDVMRGVIDGLGLDEVDVVGNSIGNVWALRAALAAPSRVRRVVLIGSGPLRDEVEAPGFIKLIASPIGAIIVRLPMSPERARAIMRDSGHGPSLDAGLVPDVFFDWRAAFHRDTDSMRNERDMVRTLIGRKGWLPGLTFDDGELAKVHQPVLWLVGDADPIGSMDAWRRATAALPNGDLQVLPGAGHVPWLDDASAVARPISDFLSR